MGFADALHADVVDINFEAWGKAASYTPPGGGAAVACSIIRDIRDDNARLNDGRPLVGQQTLEVRKSDLAAPARGGVFVLTATSETLTISDRPIQADPDGLIWRMWVE